MNQQTPPRKNELVKWDDPILYKETIPFPFEKEDANFMAELLKDNLMAYKGYGLSANQIGLPYAVFAFGNGSLRDSIAVAFNPRIIAASGELEAGYEGCLSFPGLFLKVHRPKTITLRYADKTGTYATETFTGLRAKICGHEMCHIQGKPFFAGFSKLKLEMATKRCEKKSGISYDVGKLMKLRG